MHRSKLLSLLETYSDRYPEESQTCARLKNFVARETRCFERDCWVDGHVTGSAWVMDPPQRHVLLTHHKKLDMWVQLGGHADGDSDIARVALREAEEESGLGVEFVDAEIFDIDIHEIPARKQDPAHYHYDIRFAFVANSLNFSVSDESHALSWIPLEDLPAFVQEESMLRMLEKWSARGG